MRTVSVARRHRIACVTEVCRLQLPANRDLRMRATSRLSKTSCFPPCGSILAESLLHRPKSRQSMTKQSQSRIAKESSLLNGRRGKMDRGGNGWASMSRKKSCFLSSVPGTRHEPRAKLGLRYRIKVVEVRFHH